MMYKHKYVRGRAFPATTDSHEWNKATATVVPVKGDTPKFPREYLEEAIEKEYENVSYQHD